MGLRLICYFLLPIFDVRGMKIDNYWRESGKFWAKLIKVPPSMTLRQRSSFRCLLRLDDTAGVLYLGTGGWLVSDKRKYAEGFQAFSSDGGWALTISNFFGRLAIWACRNNGR